MNAPNHVLQFETAARDPSVKVAIEGLAAEPFAPLFALSDAALRARGMRRIVAPDNPGIGYPCRVSLKFATAGEELLLVNYRHLDTPGSPYRADGPVFVRKGAVRFARADVYPEIITQWAMSLRAYDAEGMMLDADVAEKAALVARVEGWLARPEIAHVDVHSMRRGCFFCRIEREAAADFQI